MLYKMMSKIKPGPIKQLLLDYDQFIICRGNIIVPHHLQRAKVVQVHFIFALLWCSAGRVGCILSGASSTTEERVGQQVRRGKDRQNLEDI